MDLETGRQVDRYVIEGVLGRGGMAAVYRARHVQLGTLHAIKVLTIGSADVRRRMLLEGRVQASLVHPNIVAVSDVVEIDGQPGLVMELVVGPTLDDLLEEHRLTIDQCDLIAEGLFAGLGAARQRGLVHRDLKPANILLAASAEGFVPKIADFGLAKVLEEDGDAATRTRSGLTMGTPAYMSPEQIRNAKGVDHRADVFALGAILYEMVCGRRAFDGEDLLDIFNSIAQAKFPAPREIVPDLPERMERAILGALEVDREKRIQDVAALRAIWRGETGVAPVATVSSGPWSTDMVSKWSDSGSSAPPLSSSVAGAGSYDTWLGGATVGPNPPAAVAAPSSVESLAPTPTPAPRKRGLPVGLAVAGIALLALVAVGVCAAGGVGGAGLLALGAFSGDDGAVALVPATPVEVAPTAPGVGPDLATEPAPLTEAAPVAAAPVEAAPVAAAPKPVAAAPKVVAPAPVEAPRVTPPVEPEPTVTPPVRTTVGPGAGGDAPVAEGGTINQAEVDQVLRKRNVAAQACWGRALLQQVAHDRDRAVVKFAVGIDGEPENVRVGSTTLDYPWFRQCLVKVVENTDFPRAKGGPADVSWPIEFSRLALP